MLCYFGSGAAVLGGPVAVVAGYSPRLHSYTLTHTITSTSGRTLHHNNTLTKLPTSLAGSLTHPHHFA